jgi:hypothetical protein
MKMVRNKEDLPTITPEGSLTYCSNTNTIYIMSNLQWHAINSLPTHYDFTGKAYYD